jgi:UDP-N-acetylglucosamine--N-acetylmuramyl-(pentapeptide) pyrophosphoryl-undecaprenol N-acetylglucosamine transferase
VTEATAPSAVHRPPSAPRTLLLAASTGGHLAQLVRLAPGLGAADDSLWVTFRSPQSESLLADKRVVFVPYIRPRDFRGVAAAFRTIRGIVSTEKFDGAVSTGSAIALAALPAARLARIPALYIESVSRVHGPSLTGRIIAASGIASLRTQHPAWSNARWRVHPSVLETYERRLRPVPASRPSLFVTLGTIEGYRFDSLVDAVLASGLAGDDTVWQLGFSAGRTDLPGRVFDQISAEDFDRYAREADVVVTHAGVGTILGLLEMGVYPVAAVRRVSRGEHVDDHQEQIAGLMTELKVGVAAETTALDREHILEAARYTIDRPDPVTA